ncbi:proline-, glutamic acid- and leucine-rich protein 1-like [Salvia splendens]|uniref:proline-, glutamic acid- and leucine-rich protein 1-like n=1 Tax=Salvia splendens TaxID=180675 RepID=UPI001C252046|nr:proline-, glutamic acid- and leucine-rich protein 1-like [Salvia splendens]
MGKKAFAKKTKPSCRGTPEAHPQPNPPAPVAQPPPMVSLDAMMAFLRQQDPTRDWTTALTSFGQTGGVGTTSSEAPPAPVSHAAVSVPDSAELDAIAAHYDSDSEERKKKSSQVGNGEKATSGTIPEGRPSQLVGGEGGVPSKEKEPVDPQVKAGDDRMRVEEESTASTEVKDTGAEIAEPEVEAPTPVAPQVVKPIPVSKAKPNTVEDPIEIASEEERATPKMAESEPVQATDQEDTGVSPVQNEPGTTTEGMAGGPNLISESGRSDGSEKDEALLQAEEEARMEKAMEEVREDNKQLKAEMVKLAGVVERMLEGSAEQRTLTQRQAVMETIVTKLGEENQRLITEMGRMDSVIEELLEEVTSQRKEQAGGVRGSVAQNTGPSGHGGQEKEAEVPAEAEESAKDDTDRTETEEERLKEQSAPPAPRRSRRLR